VIAALFDFDGTLYTGHIWQDLVRHHWVAGVHRRWVVAYVVRNVAPVPLYRLGLISQKAFFHAWAETLAWLLRGWTLEEAQALFDRLTDEQIMPNLRGDVLERLGQHQRRGHQVALVSGTFAPWLSTVAQRLAIPHAVGTRLQVQDGRYTGRIIPPLCQGEGKASRVDAFFSELGLEVDWSASHAYADRISDTHLLNRVGHPVAVYPDEELLAKAQAQNWPIMAKANP
jgi:putative phosphoserine phosphatase/1-acylglycerol-3-phosphate O-acyltransferase